ncbi:MAG: VRR-NUC domain-containing protein [Caulobacterales bacterium]|nr:VRR-NUC domain-containing protein [Caulobacterales bacterium]
MVSTGPKRWRATSAHDETSLERAALVCYEADGWLGDHGEGGLILTLIKAASIRRLPESYASAFVEGLYYHPTAEGLPTPSEMLANIKSVTTEDIGRTYSVVAMRIGAPEYYPSVTLDKVLGLFSILGAQRLEAIAALFAQAPYDLRAGWPDLTLWRANQIVFREVKGPGDRVHASQRRLIQTILKPLGALTSALSTSKPPRRRFSRSYFHAP